MSLEPGLADIARSVPFGMNVGASRFWCFRFEPRCQGGVRIAEPDVDLQPPRQLGVAGHFRAARRKSFAFAQCCR